LFNLIITIISIALVVAMAAAAVYYGGSAFTQGTAKANAATLVTQAQQINGAITLFKNDNGGTAPTSIDDLSATSVGVDLVPAYLQNAPVPGSAGSSTAAWTLSGGNSVVEAKGLEVCKQVNAASGHDGSATLTTAVYGCQETAGAGQFNVTYKN